MNAVAANYREETTNGTRLYCDSRTRAANELNTETNETKNERKKETTTHNIVHNSLDEKSSSSNSNNNKCKSKQNGYVHFLYSHYDVFEKTREAEKTH